MARAKKYTTKYFGIGGGKEIPVVVNSKEEPNGNYTYIFNLSEFKNLVSNFDTKAVALADKLESRTFILAAYKHTNSVYVEMENKATTPVIIEDIYHAIRSVFADPLKNANNDPKGTSGVASIAASSGSSFIAAPTSVTPLDPYNDVTMGMDDLEPYYVLPKTAIQVYRNKKVKDCYSFFVTVPRMGILTDAQIFNKWLNTKVFSNIVKVDTYPTVMGDKKAYRYDFFFEIKKVGDKFITSAPSLDVQETTFKQIDDKLIADFDIPDFSDITGGQSAAPVADTSKDAVAASSYDTIYEEQLDTVKKEIEQLISMRSFVSPIDFEKKIQFNQKIDEAQRRLNDLNFKIVESRLTKDDIFEDLFEQSFTPIKNDYQDVYASNQVGEQPVSADFFTPNGQPSKLSDALNQLIRTPQFNEWFGNWQLSYAYRDNVDDSVPCSTVTTKDFEPLLVWHGTGTQFSYFRFDNFPAAYFAVTKAYSEWFADLHGGGEGYTIPFFLNIRNPLDLSKFKITKIKPKEFFDFMFLKTGMDMEQLGVNPIFMDSTLPPMETWVYLRNNPTMLQKIADSHVYDGIHFYESNPSVPEGQAAHSTEAFIIFNPNQCKIADPERGLFMLGSLKSFLLKYGGKI